MKKAMYRSLMRIEKRMIRRYCRSPFNINKRCLLSENYFIYLVAKKAGSNMKVARKWYNRLEVMLSKLPEIMKNTTTKGGAE